MRADSDDEAVEQPRAELAFELGDTGGERGLGDADPLGRAAEITNLGDGQEIAQQVLIHDRCCLSGWAESFNFRRSGARRYGGVVSPSRGPDNGEGDARAVMLWWDENL